MCSHTRPVPLPSDPKSPWPPKTWASIQREIQEADAWYSGAESKLSQFYGGPEQTAFNSRRRFWGRANRDANNVPAGRQRLHVPAAADIAATSADLLFGQTPGLVIPTDDPAGELAVGAAQDRWNELDEANGLGAVWLEAAELNAALGGVYLHPAWDPAVADYPMVSVVHADCAVPEFRWGRLVAVTFWHTVTTDGSDTLRHLERHEPGVNGGPGVILHGLYKGTVSALGSQMSWQQALLTCPDLEGLAANDEGVVTVPDGITFDVRYVPNVRPNRRHREQPVGRHDWQGAEDLMDALDETYTSWVRDIRLGKARLIVPNSYLDRRGRGKGTSFDMDAEVFSPLDIEPGANSDKMQLTENQFAIRFAEHAATAGALFDEIVGTSGYSPQSFGKQGDGSDQTATEVDARESKSERTTDRKRRYWTPALEDIGLMLLIVDRAVFNGKAAPLRPRVVWPQDPDQTPLEQAQTLNMLTMAEAASTEVKVAMLHPDWSADEVAGEVGRIQSEHALVVPDPTGSGLGGE